MGKSDRLDDAYRFKTPSLRNVAVTPPYGHNGAYPTLERMIKHHLDPLAERSAWQRSDAALPPAPHIAVIDFVIQSDTREMARQSSVLDIDIPARTQTEIDQIIAFLETLTDPSPYDRPLGRPETVPSGLPVD
jgi:cytochrome c peroxidase